MVMVVVGGPTQARWRFLGVGAAPTVPSSFTGAAVLAGVVYAYGQPEIGAATPEVRARDGGVGAPLQATSESARRGAMRIPEMYHFEAPERSAVRRNRCNSYYM